MKFSHNRHKFFLYWIGLVATLFMTFFITAWWITVKPLQFEAPISGTWGNFSPDVRLTAEAISVDPISRTIVMNWYPDFTMLNCHASTPAVLDVFMYSGLLDNSSPSWSPQLGDQPAYRLNTTESCFRTISVYSSFRTVTKLIASKDYLRLQAITMQSTFQSYPFDIYLAPFVFYTRNVNTGKISPLAVSNSFGVAVNFKISLLNNAFLSYNGLVNSIQFFLRIERSMAMKAFVVMVGVTNWLIAIAFLTICIALIVYRSTEIYREMFVVPVTTLFAFSSIRANFPGAPAGFGATIDTFTILPVLIIMSLCSFALLLTILYRRICEDIEIKKITEHGVIEKAMTPALRLSTQPYNLSSINIPHIQTPRASSSVISAEEGTNHQGNINQPISCFLNIPQTQSRRSSSQFTRVQEWNNNQVNVDHI